MRIYLIIQGMKAVDQADWRTETREEFTSFVNSSNVDQDEICEEVDTALSSGERISLNK